MIAEFGHFALILALLAAMMQIISPIALRSNPNLLALVKNTSMAQCLFVTLSMVSLTVCFILNDFSVAYVAQNSNSQLPLLFRIGAVWGAHEGSILLWLWILSIWTMYVGTDSKSLPAMFRVNMLHVLAIVSLGFLLFILFTSNPFLRLLPNIPVDGRDLNPLLQDPGLVMHPPILYTGYVGMAVPFAFACAALMVGDMRAEWAGWLKAKLLFAWCFLTVGIIAGSWWAYRELGWGGWWFWDPVENASLLPWLLSTALVHSILITAKRGAFSAWTVLLAIGCFALSLIGTFLVRSGILVSVHAFANDATRGAYILAFLGVVLGASLMLYAIRGHTLSKKIQFDWLSRESLLLSNNCLLLVAMLTVLLGTIYPLIIDSMGLGKLSVGPPYFNSVMVPIFTPLLFLMALVPLFYWRKSDSAHIKKGLIYSVPVSLVLAIALPYIFTGVVTLHVALGVVLALMIIFSSFYSIYSKQKRWSMLFAHLGVAVTVLGIVLASAYSQKREVRATVGEVVSLAGYQFVLDKVDEAQGPNYKSLQAKVTIKRDNIDIAVLHPEQRLFTVQNMALAKTAIDVGIFRDLYVALGQPLAGDAWALRLYYKPFVRWIWYGGILMLLGGIIGLVQKNREA